MDILELKNKIKISIYDIKISINGFNSKKNERIVNQKTSQHPNTSWRKKRNLKMKSNKHVRDICSTSKDQLNESFFEVV